MKTILPLCILLILILAGLLLVIFLAEGFANPDESESVRKINLIGCKNLNGVLVGNDECMFSTE
jgi:hypothetical protein